MYAIKGNKQYTLTNEAERKNYLAQGYDIVDDDGDIIEYSPTKTMPFKQVAETIKNAERLEKQNAALEAELAEALSTIDGFRTANEELTRENAALKTAEAEAKSKK